MNNKFASFVKKSKTKVMLILSLGVLIIFLVTFLSIKLNPFIIVPCFFAIFIIIVSANTNKERKQMAKYNLGVDVDSNIYIPLVLDIEYLNKLSHELNDKIEISNGTNNLVNYVQYMIDNNQMIFVEKKFKLDTIVDLINNLMKAKNINLIIDKNDILKNDDEVLKLRRKDNITTDFHDLSCIRAILEANQLELIRFFAPYDGFSKLARIDGYVLSVVPLTKVDTLKKLQLELSNKLNYK